MSHLVDALKKHAAYKPGLPLIDARGMQEGTHELEGQAPLNSGSKLKDALFRGLWRSKIDVNDEGQVTKGKMEARVAPTALGYGTAAAGGAGIGGGIGALVADNRLIGGLTGGAVGAVAAPLALLIASKQGMLDPIAKKASMSEFFNNQMDEWRRESLRRLNDEVKRQGGEYRQGGIPYKGDWRDYFAERELSLKSGRTPEGADTLSAAVRTTPTGLGYGTAALGGGGLGAGIGALASKNKAAGALTGGAIGAVATPLALLLASKQGWLGKQEAPAVEVS